MTWKEKVPGERESHESTPEMTALYNMEKEKGLPVISSEPGKKEFEPVSPQPVQSPGIYEAEFMTMGKDVIFHFWPWGYHDAESLNKVPPRFLKTFPDALKRAVASSLPSIKHEVTEDRDMGAWFVKAYGLADNLFSRDLAIKVCQTVHENMGGESD